MQKKEKINTRLPIRLLFWYGAALVGIWILDLILLTFMSIDLSTGIIGATVLSATIPGDIYFKSTRELPSNSFGWRMAIGFAIVSLGMGSMQIALSAVLGNSQALQVIGDSRFLLFGLLLQLAMIGPLKWCFGWGARRRQRALDKMAAQASAPKNQDGGH